MKHGEFIEKIETVNTGGGCVVDFIHLSNGQVLTLNDECILLWNSTEDFYEGADNLCCVMLTPKGGVV